MVPDMYYAQEPVCEASRVLFDWMAAKYEEDTPMGYIGIAIGPRTASKQHLKKVFLWAILSNTYESNGNLNDSIGVFKLILYFYHFLVVNSKIGKIEV